jgi:alpha-ketoglutaric semialdehyde dehydrogenase
MLGLAGADFETFATHAAREFSAAPAGVMLTAGILQAYERGIERLARHPKITTLARGAAEHGRAQAALLRVHASDLLADATLGEEVFGPSSLLVECDDLPQLRTVLRQLEGQLTITLHMEPDDAELVRALLPLLERKAGRLLANGFPTGVEVCDAMVHGGPFPATSDGRSTSVGTAAIERFLRPVCYQNFADELLPDALREGNPLGLRRRVGGKPA